MAEDIHFDKLLKRWDSRRSGASGEVGGGGVERREPSEAESGVMITESAEKEEGKHFKFPFSDLNQFISSKINDSSPILTVGDCA